MRKIVNVFWRRRIDMALTNLNEILHKHKLWLNSDKDGQRAVFKDMDLSGINLKGEDLRDADFRHTNLEAAVFTNTDLRAARFDNSILYRATFHGANLRETRFLMCNLERADLSEVGAIGANFNESNMRDACLYGGDFRSASFRHVDFRGADMRETDFRGADLSLSAWPLSQGSAGVEVDIQFIYQLLGHVACLRCGDPEFDEIKAKIMPHVSKSRKALELLLELQWGG